MAERIEIVVSGDAKKLITELKKAGVEVNTFADNTGKAGKSSGKFTKGIHGINKAAAALGLAGLVTTTGQFALQSFKAAASAEKLGKATESLAKGIGESKESMVSAIKAASQGTVSELAAMEAANKAMMFGLVENSGQMEDLTRIAITLGNAMGQGATKSVDDLTTALGRQSPMILDNLGITLKMEEAYQIYAAQLGKSVDQLTEQEKKQAFVNAALEKGRAKVAELGGVSDDSAAKTERLAASWEDFTVALGGLLTPALGDAAVAATGIFNTMEGLSDQWAGNIDQTNLLTSGLKNLVGITDDATNSEGLFTKAVAAWQNEAERRFTTMGQLVISGAQLVMGEEKLYTAFNDTTTATYDYEATLRTANLATYTAAEAAKELENAERAKGAESERWAGIAEESVQVLDALGQGHLMTATQAEAYAEAQRNAADAERERLETSRELAGTAADYFLSLKDMQDQSIQNEAGYHASLSLMRNDAVAEQTEAADKLAEELVGIEQKRAEKLAWVNSGAHARTAEQNAEALGYWNAHFDQLVTDTEGKYGEQTAAIETELQRQENVAKAAHEREAAEYEAHLEELKLKTALGVLETTGQLEQLTGGLATSAGQAADLIAAGLVPVTEEMGVAIQAALGALTTESEAAASQAAANQDVLTQALDGSLTSAENLQLGLSGLGAGKEGGLAKAALEADSFSQSMSNAVEPVNAINEALAGLGMGGGGEGEGEGEGGGEDEGGGGGGGGGGLDGLTTQAETLSALFAETLPASIGATQTIHATMAEEMLTQLTDNTVAATDLDLVLINISGVTLPALTTGFTTTGTAALTAANTTEKGFAKVKSRLDKISPELKQIHSWLTKVEAAALRAAAALRDMRAAKGSGGGGGGGTAGARASGGPVKMDNVYLVGERGPELFMPGSNGHIVPNQQVNFGGGPPAAAPSSGSSLVIQNLNLYGIQDAEQLFNEIKKVGRSRGLQFSRVN